MDTVRCLEGIGEVLSIIIKRDEIRTEYREEDHEDDDDKSDDPQFITAETV